MMLTGEQYGNLPSGESRLSCEVGLSFDGHPEFKEFIAAIRWSPSR
jgi:hypothetical protein